MPSRLDLHGLVLLTHRLSADMIGLLHHFKERRQLDDLTGLPPCLTVKGNPVHSGDLAFDNRPLQ